MATSPIGEKKKTYAVFASIFLFATSRRSRHTGRSDGIRTSPKPKNRHKKRRKIPLLSALKSKILIYTKLLTLVLTLNNSPPYSPDNRLHVVIFATKKEVSSMLIISIIQIVLNVIQIILDIIELRRH